MSVTDAVVEVLREHYRNGDGDPFDDRWNRLVADEVVAVVDQQLQGAVEALQRIAVILGNHNLSPSAQNARIEDVIRALTGGQPE